MVSLFSNEREIGSSVRDLASNLSTMHEGMVHALEANSGAVNFYAPQTKRTAELTKAMSTDLSWNLRFPPKGQQALGAVIKNIGDNSNEVTRAKEIQVNSKYYLDSLNVSKQNNEQLVALTSAIENLTVKLIEGSGGMAPTPPGAPAMAPPLREHQLLREDQLWLWDRYLLWGHQHR